MLLWRLLLLLSAAFVLCATVHGELSSPLLRGAPLNEDEAFCDFAESYPQQYVAYYTATPPTIDGHIDERVWAEVPFTADFVDIEGSPPRPVPRFQTRVKIRYDATHLYVAAYLQEENVWAYQAPDTVIYHDNDFEVFANPDGTTHYYKEYEVNAINSAWTLALNKPYLNGGYENSTRVFGNHGWTMPVKSAIYVDGPINNPAAGLDKFWSIELAFPLASLAYNETNVSLPPRHGQYWRMNFSRVQYRVKVVNGRYVPQNPNSPDNWVWSPTGIVNIHLPERWGYVQFSTAPVNTTQPVRDPQWTVRSVAMYLYEAQVSYFNKYSRYTDDIHELQTLAPAHTLDGTCTKLPTVILAQGAQGYRGLVKSLDGSMVATIADDRLLTVTTAT